MMSPESGPKLTDDTRHLTCLVTWHLRNRFEVGIIKTRSSTFPSIPHIDQIRIFLSNRKLLVDIFNPLENARNIHIF
ncbi:hypothetical protein VTN96DRAFT_9289 [Rasamsonia emersonii]